MSSPTAKRIDRLAASIGAVYSKRQIAAAAGVSVRTLTRWISEGKLPPPEIKYSKRTHRWRGATVEKFLEGGRDE